MTDWYLRPFRHEDADEVVRMVRDQLAETDPTAPFDERYFRETIRLGVEANSRNLQGWVLDGGDGKLHGYTVVSVGGLLYAPVSTVDMIGWYVEPAWRRIDVLRRFIYLFDWFADDDPGVRDIQVGIANGRKAHKFGKMLERYGYRYAGAVHRRIVREFEIDGRATETSNPTTSAGSGERDASGGQAKER